jgi:hypothetical protein
VCCSGFLFVCPFSGIHCTPGKLSGFLQPPEERAKAMAAKLARLVYRRLRQGMKYVDKGALLYQAQPRQLQVQQLKWKAAKLGYKVTLLPAA